MQPHQCNYQTGKFGNSLGNYPRLYTMGLNYTRFQHKLKAQKISTESFHVGIDLHVKNLQKTILPRKDGGKERENSHVYHNSSRTKGHSYLGK